MYRSSVLACSKLLFFHYQHPTVIWYNLNLNKPKVKTLVLLFLNPVFDKLLKPTLEISKWYELVAFINVARSLANWKRVFITKSILLFLNFIQNLLWVSNGQMCEKYRVWAHSLHVGPFSSVLWNCRTIARCLDKLDIEVQCGLAIIAYFKDYRIFSKYIREGFN